MVYFEFAEISTVRIAPDFYSTDCNLLIKAEELIRKHGFGIESEKLPSGQLIRVKSTGKSFDFEKARNVNHLFLKLMLDDGWEPFGYKPYSSGFLPEAILLRRARDK
jgi:hypothetical protein